MQTAVMTRLSEDISVEVESGEASQRECAMWMAMDGVSALRT